MFKLPNSILQDFQNSYTMQCHLYNMKDSLNSVKYWLSNYYLQILLPSFHIL